MAVVKREVSDSIDRGGGIDKVGTYHLVVTKLDIQPAKRDGGMIDGWKISVGVLDGTAKDSSGNCLLLGTTGDIILNNPQMTHSDGGDFARRVQDRFLVVTSLVKPEELGKEVSFDTDHAVGRQFIAKFDWNEYKGKKSVKLSGMDFWHVDDPYVDDIPKSAEYLSQLHPSLRWSNDQKKAAPSQAKSEYQESVKQTAAAAAAIDIDDI